MEVRVIIREDRHIGKSRVIQCFPKQSAVMGQAAVTDVLSGGDGMEGGEGDICLRNTLVQQRLDIGLRVNTAAARYLVDRLPARGELVRLLLSLIYIPAPTRRTPLTYAVFFLKKNIRLKRKKY